MLIVITGGTGCLGRATVQELVSTGHEVVALQRAMGPTQSTGTCKIIDTDLEQPLDKTRLPARCDAVIHLAQSRNYRNFPDAASDIFRINTAATVELADYATGAGADAFFYASTGSVYESGERPIPETGSVAPASFYAASKLAAEQLLTPFGGEMALTIARLFYLYGPGQRGVLVSNIANRLRTGTPVDLAGSDGLKSTPTFSSDAAHLIRRAIEDGWNGLYNVSSPDVVSLRTLATTIADILEVEPQFRKVSDQPPVSLLPDTTKMQAHLHGMRFTPLDEGLRRTLGQRSA